MTPERTPLAPGRRLCRDGAAGRTMPEYRIVQRLSAGGFALTYTARREPGAEAASPFRLPAGALVVVKEFFPMFAERGASGIQPSRHSDIDDADYLFDRALERFEREAERLYFLTCLRMLRAAVRLAGPAERPGIERLLAEATGRPGADTGVQVAIALRSVRDVPPKLAGPALAALATEPLPTVHDYFRCDGGTYYVMEYLDGGSLLQRLREERGAARPRRLEIDGVSYNVHAPWSGARVDAFADRLMEAIDTLHGGVPGETIIHADLKPGNIMFRSAQPDEPVLIDFGLATNVASPESALLGGTSEGFSPIELYSAPGAAEGRRGLGPWTDIYGAAGLLWVLGTGIDPIALPGARERKMALADGAADPLDRRPAWPAESPVRLSAAARAGLAIDPRDRPQSVADWRRLLAEPVTRPDGPPPLEEPEPEPERVPKPWYRHLLLGGAGLVAVLVVLVVSGSPREKAAQDDVGSVIFRPIPAEPAGTTPTGGEAAPAAGGGPEAGPTAEEVATAAAQAAGDAAEARNRAVQLERTAMPEMAEAPDAPAQPGSGAADVQTAAVAAPGTCPAFHQRGLQEARMSAEELSGRAHFDIEAGGPVDLSQCANIGRPGYVTLRPDFSLSLSANPRARRLEFRINSRCDSILMVQTPGRTVRIDDDSQGNLDGKLSVVSAQPGIYDVWVGRKDRPESCEATLTVEAF